MTKKELLKLIASEIARGLIDRGFRKDGADGYRKKTEAGDVALGIQLWSYAPKYQYGLFASVRLDLVERLCGAFDYQNPNGGPVTFGLDLSYFSAEGRISVVGIDDASKSIKLFSQTVENLVIPFLESHSDVYSLDRDFNLKAPERKDNPWGGAGPWNSGRALIVAAMAGNPRFEDLAADYRAKMGVNADLDCPFNRLVSFLAERIKTGNFDSPLQIP